MPIHKPKFFKRALKALILLPVLFALPLVPWRRLPVLAQTALFDLTDLLVKVDPITLVAHRPFDFDLQFKPTASVSDAIVDYEIYDSQGNKVYQHFEDHQNINSGDVRHYSFSWTPDRTGNYTLKMGVFTSNWDRTVYWNNSVSRLLVIDGSGNAAQPTPVGTTPTPTVTASLTPTPSPTNPPSPTATPTPISGSGYTVGNDGRLSFRGQPLQIRGVNWFGFEGDTKVAHGLWARNWQEMIKQIKGTGFNAIRLPYCPATLRNQPIGYINQELNPDLVGKNSLEIMDMFMEEFNRQQIHVLLDLHTINCQNITDLWYDGSYSQDQWINDQAFLAKRYAHLPYFMGLDLKNEPKGSATWGTGNQATDWNLAAQKAGAAVHQANPNILIFVEGIENNPTCSDNSLGHWWGGNLEPVKCAPISSSAIPADKLVYSPHVYGPDVHPQSYFDASDFPRNLPAIWDRHFGYLADQGKALAIGEFGGKYGQGDPKDVTWQNAFTQYLASKGICNSFYWSWNPNSGDTGGILADDWETVRSDKVDMLKNYWRDCH